MIYLLLTILLNVCIFMAFRSYSKFKVNTLPAIVTNYFICVVTGVSFVGFDNVNAQLTESAGWLPYGIGLGIIFITTFFLMAKSTQLRGVATTSVASKMSLAIPVIFSLFIFKIGTNALDGLNYLGILLAFVAILLVSKQKKTDSTAPFQFKHLLLPFMVFLLGGIIDTALNYINHYVITEAVESVFPIVIFATAFIGGTAAILITKTRVRWKDIFGGIYLGIPNYFSIYFQLKALRAFDNNGAIVYPTLNIGIIIFATLASVLIFKEKLSKLNLAGVGLAVIVIFLLSHQEIVKL